VCGQVANQLWNYALTLAKQMSYGLQSWGPTGLWILQSKLTKPAGNRILICDLRVIMQRIYGMKSCRRPSVNLSSAQTSKFFHFSPLANTNLIPIIEEVNIG